MIVAWAGAHSAFVAAAAEGDDDEFERWRTLNELLSWTYTMEQALQATWEELPMAWKVKASAETDAHAQRAIAHNNELAATHGISWDEHTDPAFEAYRRRRKRCRPYEHWSSLLLAGRFSDRFFYAIRWVRAQAAHVGIGLPIELRQLRPGEAPRWKWKRAAAVARSGRSQSEASLYDRELGEQDVLGLFGFLLDIFVEAQHLLIRLTREAEEAA